MSPSPQVVGPAKSAARSSPCWARSDRVPNALRNSTCGSFLMLPSCSRNMQLVRDSPAMTEMCVQLKWNWMMGVLPLGAQVRTRVGRSLRPDSSM